MTSRYINHFFSLKCASDTIGFFIGCEKRAAKEVTESMAMWWAIKDRLQVDPKDSNVVCIVVGDGAMPRTAGLICHMTAWRTYSIDPGFNLKNIGWMFGHRAQANCAIRNLCIRRSKVENVNIDCKGKRCVIVLPHSHAPLNASINAAHNYSRLDVVSLPCCVPIPKTFPSSSITYTDLDIWSPKNVMHIWSNFQPVNTGA